ncbi:tetratricopeptide repeat-containing sensor histidine kinase [Larkinella terrae]|uniref:Tetratricopeptide repeat protein n=1 Tax=Larkinella terrae TaxID=2025311 RepID=A0A7K0EIF8_9BACT|nr:tetratricopeptide repeat protein [Larkinella terrae]MRS61619.1 tetratricopeptide repeat protein [Larkinella terrae]
MRTLLILLLFGTVSVAQTPVIDSLQNRLKQLPPDSSRVLTLHELATNFWWNGYDSLAIQTLRQGMRVGKQANYPTGVIRARLALARIEADYLSDTKSAHAQLDTAQTEAIAIHDLSLQGQVFLRRAQLYSNIMAKLPEARTLLQKALAKFREAHDRRWEAQAYNELAIMQMGKGQYVEAINLWLKARRIQERMNDLKSLRATLPNLGAAYLKLNRYDDALACFAEGEKIANQLNDQMVKHFLMSRKAEILEKKKQYPAALAIYLELVKAYEKPYQPSSLARAYGSVGRLYTELKDFQKALTYSQLAQDTYRKTVEKSQEAMEHNAQHNFGEIYLGLKQYSRVIPYAQAGLAWTKDVQEMRPERTAYLRQLATAYDHLNQPAKALYYYKWYKAEADTMLNEEAIQKVTMASMTYDFEKKQQVTRLQQAQQKNRIASLENEQLEQSRNFLIALLVLSGGTLGYVFWSNRRLRTKNEELSRKNAEIEAALYRGQTMERKRVASELHDSVAAKVSALKWRLEAMDTSQFDGDQQREHNRLLDHMGEVYDDIRTISHNLMPEILEKQGLQAALIKLTDTLNVQNRTRFMLEVDDSGADVRGKTAYELYAISLELVNNILKHAKARSAGIALHRQNGFLKLTIQDDGLGIDGSKFSDGVGMRNIQSRLERLGGTFFISTPEPGGTCVDVQIPLAG